MIDNKKHLGVKSPGAKFMDIYLIQDPKYMVAGQGYNEDLLRYYKNSIPVKNIHKFIGRVVIVSD